MPFLFILKTLDLHACKHDTEIFPYHPSKPEWYVTMLMLFRGICIGQYVFFSFLKGWHGLAGNVIVISSPGDRIGGVTQLTGKSDT